MGFEPGATPVWPLPPDWAGGVSESLQWATDVMQASATAVTQHRAYQIGPSRSFSFEVLAHGDERRLLDNLLAVHRGRWLLPVWPDVQHLASPLLAGAIAIDCVTEGFDFVAGGQALLYAAPNDWEVVTINTVDAGGLSLVGATTAVRAAGAALYPLRKARVQDGAEERLRSDSVSRRRIAFDVDEACDWASLADPTLYLTHPVLESRPDESEDPTASYSRLRQSMVVDGALPFDYDLPDQALRAQSTRWKLLGRSEHTWFRSLLYTLDGRRVPMWLPSFASDLRPVAVVAGGSTAMSVAWAGYALYGKTRANRRDVRFELDDGTLLYRRITDAVEAGDSETLTLSAALDAGSIAPERIRQISFMALSTLAGDSVDIEHVTDAGGLATATLGWQSVVPDV